MFCFIASLVLHCHRLVLFFTTLPLTSACTYFDPGTPPPLFLFLLLASVPHPSLPSPPLSPPIYLHVVTFSHSLSPPSLLHFSLPPLLLLPPCCILMQNGMFYTSYVSTFPRLVKQLLPSCSASLVLSSSLPVLLFPFFGTTCLHTSVIGLSVYTNYDEVRHKLC